MNALRALIDFGKEKGLTYDIGLFKSNKIDCHDVVNYIKTLNMKEGI